MKVSELGEFGLIDVLAQMVDRTRHKDAPSWQQLILGIGDDAAAWWGDASIQLATVDALIQDVHFTLGMASWAELGGKALAVNLSDIAAMGGLPRYALVSLALPDTTEVEDVVALYRGMLELAQRFGVAIIGGNISRASQIVIDVTVLGKTRGEAQQILTRSTAKPGEKIAVTGYLGAAAAGLEMLTKHLQFDAETMACFKKAFLQPNPRIAEGQILVDCGVKTAIDISDGLVADLNHICQASQVGAQVEIECVPIQSIVKANFEDKALEMALSGGEDYELLFTASTEIIDRVKAAVSSPITVIGEVVDKVGGVTLIDKAGKPVKIPRAGWAHFVTR